MQNQQNAYANLKFNVWAANLIQTKSLFFVIDQIKTGNEIQKDNIKMINKIRKMAPKNRTSHNAAALDVPIPKDKQKFALTKSPKALLQLMLIYVRL